ncbi:MAG: serpin family protein [Christensenellales bacterium]
MRRIVIAFLLIFLLTGCGIQIQTNYANTQSIGHKAILKKQTVGPLNSSFVEGINAFGFDTVRTLYDTQNNLAFSPISVELALAMTRTGALGNTAQEIAQALHIDKLTDDQIIDACRSLMWRANTGGMEAANAIWLSNEYTFSDNFIGTCTNDFMADAMPLKIPGAMDAINAWANEKTHGKIKSILEQELDPMTRIVLCNALYFLGDWEIPFKSNATYDEEFAAPNKVVTVSFMHSDWQVPYIKNDTFSMITLDFKSRSDDGKYAMALLLPAKGTDIGETLTSLNAEAFLDALNDLKTQEVLIKIPKFEYSFFTSLNKTLKDLGMQSALSEGADFGTMTDEPNNIYITDILHKCYIRVDELGAKAAAVTAIVAPESAAPPMEEPATFYADRPFMFAIYSREDGTVAFMGVVNDPTLK